MEPETTEGKDEASSWASMNGWLSDDDARRATSMPITTTTRRRLSWRDDTTDGLATPIGINDDDDDGRGGKTMTKSSFGDAGRMALGEIDSNARLPSSEDEERRMRSKNGSTTTTYMAGSTPGALSAKHASRLATLRAEEDEEEEQDEEEEEESSVLLADDEFSFEFTGNVVDDVVTPGGSEDDSGTSDTLVLTSKASRLSRVHETLELFKSLATLAISPPSSSEATRAAPTPANTPAASNANVLLRRFEATETTTTTMDASSPVVVRDASMTSARLMSPRHGLIGKIIASMSLSDAVEIGDDEMAAISTAPRLAAFVILMTVAALMFCSAACATTAVAYAIKSPLRVMMMTTPTAKPPRVLVEGAAFAYRWWYRSGENATRFVLFFKLEDAFASYGAFFARRARESVQVEMVKRAERTIALLRSMSVAFGYCAAFLAFIAAATQVVANMTAATTTGTAMKANDDGDVDDDDDISNGSANGSTPMIVERAYLAARTFVLEPSAKTPPSLASSTQSQSSNSATPSRLIHV